MRTQSPYVLLVLASALMSATPSFSHAQTIIQVIPLPGSSYWNSAWGLEADTTSLWISSNTSDATNGRKIFELNHDGFILDSVLAPAGVNSSQGLARDDDGNFYYLRRYTAVGTIMKLSPSGVLLDTMRLASNRFIGGIAWDGEFIWYSVYFPNAEAGLYKADFANKVTIDTIYVPSQQPYGITWDGEYLYYVENGFDGQPRGIHKVDPVTGNVVGFIPEPQDQSANGTNPQDVAWDGNYLWLLAEPVGASTGRSLYKYDVRGPGTPVIQISPTLLSFGGTPLDSTASRVVTITNVGTAQLTIDSIRVRLSSRFVVVVTTPLTIGPGSSEAVTVEFSPVVYGADTVSINIYSNDPVRPAVVLAARGFGIYSGPVLSVPSSHDFGTRRRGSSNFWQMTLQNLAGQQLTVSSIATGTIHFHIDSMQFPFHLDSLQKKTIRVWYQPATSGQHADTLLITSNASNGVVMPVVLSGTGDATPISIGQPLWEYTVPLHPISNTFKLVKAVRAINDITGDGKPEIVISTENYWTMVVNGNASITTDSLWAFTTYVSNSSAGSIGSTGDYSHQKALAIASDLNNDGYNDVVIGTGGGNERVYALNGRTGQMLWSFGTDHPDSFGLGDFTGVDVARDFNGDGIPDVVAAAAATQSGGVAGRRSAYLFDGATGAILWQAPLLGFTHGVMSMPDMNGDGIPDVVGTVGEPAYRASAFSGVNGAPLWDFSVSSGSGGAKEVMFLPIAGHAPAVILGAFWGPVYRLDAATGSMVWSSATGGSGVMQLDRLPDITGDGIDEILVALLGAGARCLNGATGAVIWSIGTGNTMGIARIPDLDQDGIDEVAIAVQNQGAMIVSGQDGQQLALYPTGTNQAREIALVSDLDGNYSSEMIMGGREGNVAMLSGGINAGPTRVGEQPFLPSTFTLYQNYPNPFNPSTTILFTLPERTDPSITIFDVLGRRVRSFDFENAPPGAHQIVWDAKDASGVSVSSGVYFYQLRAGTTVKTRSMMLQR